MLDSYFFIPGKEKYLDKLKTLKSEYYVIDLEDAISTQDKAKAFELILSYSIDEHFFVRIPFFDKSYTEQQIIKLINHFDGRIVLPKLKDSTDVRWITSMVSKIDFEMIVLVENPQCFINLQDICKEFSSQIRAIGFGSHDFCSLTGIKHTNENLIQYKRQLVLIAKAFDIDFIDGVDLDLNNFTHFIKECTDAFEMGANGKFLIHPKQLEELKNIRFFSENEWEELKVVYEKIKEIPDDSIDVYTINGKVYEKPHIARIKYLMNKSNNL